MRQSIQEWDQLKLVKDNLLKFLSSTNLLGPFLNTFPHNFSSHDDFTIAEVKFIA